MIKYDERLNIKEIMLLTEAVLFIIHVIHNSYIEEPNDNLYNLISELSYIYNKEICTMEDIEEFKEFLSLKENKEVIEKILRDNGGCIV